MDISLTSSQDTFLYLLRGADAHGAAVTDNDDVETGNTNSRITETLAAGTYTIEATTYGEGVTGGFTLSVVPAGTTAPPPPATDSCFQDLGALTGAITRNASWTGDCASTHRTGRYARFYSFTLSQRTEVDISLTSSQDTFLYLLRGADAHGTVVTDNDDVESGNTNSRITETLAAGTYTIEATTYGEGVTGGFTLSVVPAGTTAPVAPPADACEYVLTAGAAAAPPGGSISGQWTGDCTSTHQAGSYARYYTFTLTAASEVTITLESSVDTFLYLLEGAGTVGTVVAENDDIESGNTNSQITEFLAAGTYTIEATTYKEAITGEFALTVTSITVTPVPGAGDREALVALYHATGGANWENNHNWLSNAPLDQWYGVTTDSGGRVTELILRDNELAGRIPSELGNLTNLTILRLSRNQLRGEIPAELGNLPNLTFLYLSINQLSGELPTALGNLYALERLSLRENEFTGPIPSWLSRMTNLQVLSLRYNRFSGPIPSWLGRLGNLERLYLSYNQLSGEIPSELTNLTNLTLLYLEGNRLTGCIPDGLQDIADNDFTTLGLLFCGAGSAAEEDRKLLGALYDATGGANWVNNHNWLSNSPLGQWYGVTTNISDRVTELELVENRLSGQIPAALSGLSNLRKLRLQQNQLRGRIPGELGSLTNLEELDFWSNQLDGQIPPELGNLSNLSYLFLGINQLSGEIPSALGRLANLKELHLAENQLGGEIPPHLGNLTNLRLLYLESNQLDGEIPAQLGNLSNLDHLHLHHNRLSGEIPAQLGNLSNLLSVRLSGNQLTGCIPEGLRNVVYSDFDALGLPFCGDGSPDLVAAVTSVGDAGILYVGESFTINAQVHNQGTGPSASTTLRYYRSANDTISSSDAEIGTDSVRSLEVSGSSPESISLTAPSSAGTYYYGACVDSVAGESNTQNNCSEGYSVAVLEPAFVSTIECRTTSFGTRYTIEGTVFAVTALSNVTVIGYGIDSFGQRTKVGEDDLGSMSARTSETFSISGFNRLYTSCDYSLEWQY